jgi:hypothetical protein
MNNREISAYAIVVLVLFVILPTIYYDMGYRAGAKGTSEEPTPLRIMTGVVSLNTTTYNMSWYDMGFGDSEQAPTLRNDIFLMYINAHWGESDKIASNDEKTPHTTITIAILPFDYDTHNFTIERIVICWRSLAEGQQIDNYYDNNRIEASSVDNIGIILFGYGSYQNNIDMWVTRYIVFTISQVWYEEVSVAIPTIQEKKL